MGGAIRYLEVEKDLRKSIVKGQFENGQLLPSENELCNKYGLARMTVRKALNNLELEGLIERKKGKGSFVRKKRTSIELLSIRGFTEVMKSKVRQIETRFQDLPRVQRWEEPFFWKLSESEQASEVIYFSRIRILEGKPIMFEKTFFVNQLENFCHQNFINDSLFDTFLVNYDIEIKGVEQKFRAVSASKQLAKALRVDLNAPVLEITRKLKSNLEDFYIYSFAYCNTSDFMIET